MKAKRKKGKKKKEEEEKKEKLSFDQEPCIGGGCGCGDGNGCGGCAWHLPFALFLLPLCLLLHTLSSLLLSRVTAIRLYLHIYIIYL